jgi:hypothetical protein
MLQNQELNMVQNNQLEAPNSSRGKYIRGLGTVATDVITPQLNPRFLGGPAWPNLRQAWQVVRRGSNTIIISDGLSDPFADKAKPTIGYGLEILAESSDPMPETLPEIQQTWLFDLVFAVSQEAAHIGDLRQRLDKDGVISYQLPLINWLSDTLDDFATPDNTIGVLLGMTPPDYADTFIAPSGSIKVVTVKLLCPSELQSVTQGQKAARDQLMNKFIADGSHHVNSLSRAPDL